MANLTASLDSINSGKPIVDPQLGLSPNIFKSASNIFGDVLDSIGTSKDSSAMSEAYKAFLDYGSQKEALAEGGGLQQGSGLPSPNLDEIMSTEDRVAIDEIKAAGNSAKKVIVASNQGRLPKVAVNITLEKTLADLRARHPGREAIIYSVLKEIGRAHV